MILALFAIPSLASGDTLSITRAIEIAFSHRASIRAAELRVRSAEFSAWAMGAPLATRLEAGRGSLPDIGGGEDLLIAQPVDLFGRAAANRAAGTALLKASQAALRQSKLDLEVDVVEAYADLVSAQQLVTTGKDLFGIASKVYDATKRQVDLGDLQPAQILRIDLERERAKQTLQVRERALCSARIRLASTLGVPESDLPGSPLVPVEGLIASGKLSGRPDIQSLSSDIAGAKADGRLGRLSALPEIELQFRRAPFSADEQYGVRLQLVVPLWDHGAARDRTRSADRALKAAVAAFEDRRSTATAEVEAARLDREAAQAAVESFGKLVQEAHMLLEKEQRGYDLGASTLLDVLSATRALREIQEGLIDARRKLASAESAYLRATGTIVGETK